MAKKPPAKKPPVKKPAPKNPGKKKPGDKNQTNDNRKTDSMTRDLLEDFMNSSDIAGKIFTNDPLTRLDDRRSTETQNLLNLRLAYADPANASFAGRRSSDTMDILSRMKSGLEGYTAPELNAFREKQTRGMDSDLATNMNTATREQQRGKVLGGSSMAQKLEMMRQDREKRNELDQDLFVKNADERRSRLTEYGGAVKSAEDTEYARGREARGDYENTLNTDTADRFAKQNVNLGQERADRAGDAASKLGVMGILQTMRDRKQQNALMKESIAKGTGGPSSNGGSASNPYADYSNAIMDYIKQMQGGSSGATA